MQVAPLADLGLIVRFDSEAEAVRYASAIARQAPPWAVDVVPSYRSVGIVLRPGSISVAEARKYLEGVSPDRGPLAGDTIVKLTGQAFAQPISLNE